MSLSDPILVKQPLADGVIMQRLKGGDMKIQFMIKFCAVRKKQEFDMGDCYLRRHSYVSYPFTVYGPLDWWTC